MAHNLEIKEGKASCYLLKVPGWHKLGHVSDKPLSEKEVRKHAGHQFKVEKVSDFVKKGLVGIPGKVATVRMDTNQILGLVSENYGLVQLDEVYAFIRRLGEFMKGDVVFESALTLGRGERFAVGIRIQDEFRFKDDVTYPYLYINGSFDGSLRHSILPTHVREICDNTQRIAIANADSNAFFTRHYGNIGLKLENAEPTFRHAMVAWQEEKRMMKAMLKTQVTAQTIEDILEEVLGEVDAESQKALTRRNNILQEVTTIFEGDTCAGISGKNLFTAWNAMTEWMDHRSPMKEKEEKVALSEGEIAQNRFEANMWGRTADKKDQLLEYVKTLI